MILLSASVEARVAKAVTYATRDLEHMTRLVTEGDGCGIVDIIWTKSELIWWLFISNVFDLVAEI